MIKLFENRILITSGDNKNKKIKNSGFFYSYLLSEIKSLLDGTNEKEIPLKQNKNIFEIITYDDDKLILKAKNKEDKNDWMISISILVSKFKENRLIFQLENKINELNKNNYDEIMKIIFNFFIVKSLISIKKGKNIFFQFLNNKIIQNLIENILMYKICVYDKQFIKAYSHFLEIFNVLQIEN